MKRGRVYKGQGQGGRGECVHQFGHIGMCTMSTVRERMYDQGGDHGVCVRVCKYNMSKLPGEAGKGTSVRPRRKR
jgi:hypothetical protein